MPSDIGFVLGQWSDPHRQKQNAESAENAPHFVEESTIAECSHCHSHNLRRAGWFTSKLWEEKQLDVQCRDCNRYSRLPVGVTVPLKPRHGPGCLCAICMSRKSRPAAICDCGSVNLRPRGWRQFASDGRQQAECRDCGKWFVLDAGVIVSGARNTDHEHHFALPDAAEEAAGLVRLFETGECDCEEIRALIRVSESEKRCLEFLADAGMLAAHNVQRMLQFREKVLEIFNRLAATKESAW